MKKKRTRCPEIHRDDHESEERIPELDRLGEEAWVDLAHLRDPHLRECRQVLLGISLKESSRQYFQFLPSADIRCLLPGLVHAFERLGGIPRVVELSLAPPFCRSRAEGDEALHLDLEELAYAYQILFVFPGIDEPCPHHGWGRNLEPSFRFIQRDFLAHRPRESLEDRNRALDSWLGTDGRPPLVRHGSWSTSPCERGTP